jgi:hypothetical protein
MHATADTQHHDPKRRYLCRHVHTDGHRCGSPALRAQNFCYYHDRQRLPNAPLAGRTGIFRMQPIDDRAAIQIALFDILSRLTAGDLDTKRASILLYGLQIASSNLAARDKQQPTTQPIEHLTTDHHIGDLAPIQEIPTEQIEKDPLPDAKQPLANSAPERSNADQTTSLASTDPRNNSRCGGSPAPTSAAEGNQLGPRQSLPHPDLVNAESVLPLGRLEFGIHPVAECVVALGAAEEVMHQVVGGF